ncbi:MAG TPA: hypothetical protein DEG47_24425 [Cyanobacteria bacterium UBA11148]|nr:hypothetical protein [Cyanobacteria bacterium UBA11148]
MDGWPSKSLFNCDYQIISLSEDELEFLQACDANSEQQRTVGQILMDGKLGLEGVRSLLKQQLILLTPG